MHAEGPLHHLLLFNLNAPLRGPLSWGSHTPFTRFLIDVIEVIEAEVIEVNE